MSHPQDYPGLWKNETGYVERREQGLDRKCPNINCSREDSIYIDPPMQNEPWIVVVPVDCMACGASWNEAYYLKGYDIFYKHES